MALPVSSVFGEGKLSVRSYEADASAAPPKPLLIVTPADEAGSYPVILFLHGFAMMNKYYRQLLEHISSHGYITVAPQFPILPLPASAGDVAAAAEVTDWLSTGLQAALPPGIQANLLKLALAGHSKGGHSAFALALKKDVKTTLGFSVLLGIDPVAGSESPFGEKVEVSPRILTNEPNSFDLDIPVLVVGTGLGEEKAAALLPACAPAGLNHAEFFRECRPPSSYFVVKDYGHMDMLDDDAPALARIACRSGGSPGRGLMRRTVGGLVVAFLKAYLGGDRSHLDAVVRSPGVAPAALDPVGEKGRAASMVPMSRL